jgi:hypothetical protein
MVIITTLTMENIIVRENIIEKREKIIKKN